MNQILAIDPGSEQSAVVVLDHAGRIASAFKADNSDVLAFVKAESTNADIIAIEQVRSYGMPVGAEVFDTVYWSGRFAQATGRADDVTLVPRLDVKTHLCHSAKAKDSNIRQAIVDRYGGKLRAIGNKCAQGGPLYGVKADCWAALAVALTVLDRRTFQIARAA